MSDIYKQFDDSKLDVIVKTAHEILDWFYSKDNRKVTNDEKDKVILSMALLWALDQKSDYTAQRNRSVDDVETLRAALGKYGKHDIKCASSACMIAPCNCGFSKALAATEPKS